MNYFPVHQGRKEPLVKWRNPPADGYDWTATQFEGCNQGLAPDHTFLVLDVDTKNSELGAQSLKQLIEAKLIRATYIVNTPSGGVHLYYKLPEPTAEAPYQPITNKAGWMPGIDIRAAGGYVLTPGSKLSDHPNTQYNVKSGSLDNMSTIHPDLLKRLPTKGPDKPDSTYPQAPKYAQIDAQASSALITTDAASEFSDLPDHIPAGQRDDTLFRYACSWRERGYPMAHAVVLMEAIHGKLEQPEGDRITLDAAVSTLKRAYKTYRPGEQVRAAEEAAMQAITPEATPTTTTLKAQVTLGKPADVKDALTRFLYCADGNQVIDTHKPPQVATIPIGSFNSLYANIKFKKRDGKNFHPLPKIWLEHANRLSVDALGYKPKGETTYTDNSSVLYNTWRESPLAAQASELEAVDPDKIGTFMNHLDYLFGGDEEEKKLFSQWLAYAIKYPERRAAWAVLIIADIGIGKSWFHELLKTVMGGAQVKTPNSKAITSEFNSWIVGCSFVVVHELLMSGTKLAMEEVKNMITESEIMVNEKQVKRAMTRIYASILCFSNYAHAANIAARDRKFFVYRSTASQESEAYYTELFGWLKTDGPVHLLKYIQDMDLSAFNPAKAPMETSAKREMVAINMSPVEQLIRDACTDKIYPFDVDIVGSTRVTQWVMDTFGVDKLEHAEVHSVRTTLGDLSVAPLPQDRYSVPGVGQLRLKAVRRGEQWRDATATTVINEYMRSVGRTLPTDKPHLEAVK